MSKAGQVGEIGQIGIKPGAEGVSYYKVATLKFSASKKAEKAQVDREAAETLVALLAGQGDGRISMADVKKVLAKITDGGRYGRGESPIARLLLAACDDRKNVTIDMGNGPVRVQVGDGKNGRPEAAEKAMKHLFHQFWGGL